MAEEIVRKFTQVVATIGAGAAESNVIDLRAFAGGSLLVPAGWDAANIGFKVGITPTGTFGILRDTTGATVQVSGVVVGTAAVYALPDEIFGAHFLKLWSKNVGADADDTQADAVTLVLMLKG